MSEKNAGTAGLKNHIEAQVREFESIRENFDALLDVLVFTLQHGVKTLPGFPIVHGRVKEMDSFVEKCIRKHHKYKKPARQLTDLCGVRVIVVSQDAIPAVCRFIEAHFLINEQENTSGRLKEMEFGYQSVHYIVSLRDDKKEVYQSKTGKIPKALFKTRSVEEAKAEGLLVGPVFKAEIQVRTLLQHAWSSAVHDTLYKAGMKKKPRHLVRESALIAALLEEADASMAGLIQGTGEYRSCYGAYMTEKEMRHEVQLQEIILSHDPSNVKAALKMARLADCLTDQTERERVEAILSLFEDTRNAEVLRELGIVRWKLEKKDEGFRNLEDAALSDPENPNTWCELGRICLEKENFPRALECFGTAFEKAPEYPMALTGFVECQVLTGMDHPEQFIPLIRHNLEKAVEKSLQQIDAGVHLPHAWYDIGFFKLLLGRPYESLTAYAKAVGSTSSPALVQSALNSLTRMQTRLSRENSELAQGMTWVRTLLNIMLRGRYQAMTPESPDTLDASASHNFQAGEKIIIVAGSCSKASEKIMLEYEPLIRDAFAGFCGTLCSGGTNAGVSGIVGRLGNSGGRIRKIAYLPKGRDCMKSYDCISSDSDSFGPMEPLKLWNDILLSGIAPSSVRVLGLRGGKISLFEYELALLLGARVGVLPDSGGASRQLAEDPHWATDGPVARQGESTTLLRLPLDIETLRAFINPSRPSGLIDPITREKMAETIHEGYSKNARETYFSSALPGNIAPWGQLDATFKAASLGLIDHIEDKLKRIGLSLRKASAPILLPYAFSPEELAVLAEMEHGRWVTERLEDGWTLGERNDEKKTRPQLIPWSLLSEIEKQKDYDFILSLPKILLDAGYEIFPNTPSPGGTEK